MTDSVNFAHDGATASALMAVVADIRVIEDSFQRSTKIRRRKPSVDNKVLLDDDDDESLRLTMFGGEGGVHVRQAMTSDKVRDVQTVLSLIICSVVFISALLSWNAASDYEAEARKYALHLLLIPAMNILAFSLLAQRTMNEERVCQLWSCLVLGMPLVRFYAVAFVPAATLVQILEAHRAQSVQKLLHCALMLAGGLHAVVPWRRSIAWKLGVCVANYLQEFAIAAIGYARIGGELPNDKVWWIIRKVTSFDKFAPFLLGFLVTEVVLRACLRHLATWRSELEQVVSAKDASLRMALKENMQLEESQRDLQFRTHRLVQRAKEEKQELISCLKTMVKGKSLPAIPEAGNPHDRQLRDHSVVNEMEHNLYRPPTGQGTATGTVRERVGVRGDSIRQEKRLLARRMLPTVPSLPWRRGARASSSSGSSSSSDSASEVFDSGQWRGM